MLLPIVPLTMLTISTVTPPARTNAAAHHPATNAFVLYQDVHPQIAGNWVINEKDSQRPVPARGGPSSPPAPSSAGPGNIGVIPTGTGGSKGGGGGRRRGGGGSSGSSSSGGGASGGGAAQRGNDPIRNALEDLMDTGGDMVIQQTDSTITFISNGGAPIVVRPNGKGSKINWGDVGDFDTKAEWTRDGFQMERKFDGGVKIVELYSRDPATSRLTIMSTVSAKILQNDFSFKRVYDPAAAK